MKDKNTDIETCHNNKCNVNENINELPITEFEWAIRTLKDGKGPGHDNITTEMIKASGEVSAKIYHQLCKEIWKTSPGQKIGDQFS